MLCDKHIVKMILESAQMLSTVARNCGYTNSILYAVGWAKHPCTLWAGETYSNWEWLCLHGIEMGNQYCQRYTKDFEKQHKSSYVIEYIYKNKLGPKEGSLTPFAQAMPEEYKNTCAVTAYRNYYHGEKAYFAKWKNTNPPYWWEG